MTAASPQVRGRATRPSDVEAELHDVAVDLDRGLLTIDRSVIEVAGGVIEKDTKTHAARQLALGR